MTPTSPKIPFIDLKAQYTRLKPAVDARIQSVLDHGQFIMGPEVGELERRLAEYVGVGHCIGVSDGTTALMVAMMALDIGPGDEVITTPFTFIATAEMISLLGARPVFVDIDPHTCNIDPSKIEAAITPRTRAIMPVSLYGQCADMDPSMQSRRATGCRSSKTRRRASAGSTMDGDRAGLTTIACTSFFPSKPLGCYGDGGACFTNDDALALRMAQIRVHGQSKRYVHTTLGINGRLDTLQAAILLAKFDAFPAEVDARAAAGARYDTMIRDAAIAGVQPTAVLPGSTSVYAQYTVRVANRESIAARLAAAGVPTAVHYPVCLHQQPVYANAGFADQTLSRCRKGRSRSDEPADVARHRRRHPGLDHRKTG